MYDCSLMIEESDVNEIVPQKIESRCITPQIEKLVEGIVLDDEQFELF